MSANSIAESDSLTVTFPIRVYAEGSSDVASEITVSFELTGESGAPMPEGSDQGAYRFVIDGSGTAEVFIRYSSEGVWHYSLKAECAGGVVRPDVLEVTVRTYYEDGELKAVVLAKNSEGKKCGFDFTVTTDPVTPLTGGPSWSALGLLIPIGFILLAAAIVIDVKERKKETLEGTD